MLVFFPSFGFFSGVAHCCSSGFGRFRCFCVSCVCFCLFCLAFVSVLFALFLVLWLDVVFFVFFLFFFLVVFFVLFFFGGFKGHVRWPEGPPHLALNPPYFILFVFLFLFFLFFLFLFCFFVVFLFVFFWRV